MTDDAGRQLTRILNNAKGMPCWHVSCGGAAGSTFQLALGEMIPRLVPIKNPMQPASYRHNEGQINLLVWCAWRLDGPSEALTSSDDGSDQLVVQLERLIGATVTSVNVVSPGFDLTMSFDNDLVLRVFCNHVGPEASFDGNWDLVTPEMAVYVSVGSRLIIEDRKPATVANVS